LVGTIGTGVPFPFTSCKNTADSIQGRPIIKHIVEMVKDILWDWKRLLSTRVPEKNTSAGIPTIKRITPSSVAMVRTAVLCSLADLLTKNVVNWLTGFII
jgi:hypothetical protein